jgi:hypothetical protein
MSWLAAYRSGPFSGMGGRSCFALSRGKFPTIQFAIRRDVNAVHRWPWSNGVYFQCQVDAGLAILGTTGVFSH